MKINWVYMAVSLVLLLPPLPLSESLRRFVLSVRRNAGTETVRLLRPWQNWVDLLRAGAGAYVLLNFVFEIIPGSPGAGSKVLMMQGAALGLAVISQMLRFGRGVQLVAPIFFLSGMTVVFSGYLAGGFGVFVGWLFALGGQRPVYQLPMMAIALGVAGYVLGIDLRVLLNSGLILIPPLTSFMFQKPLVYVASEAPRLEPPLQHEAAAKSDEK